MTTREGTPLAAIRAAHDQRGVLLGTTGSGKTTLARYLLEPYPFVVAIDPKCTLGRTEKRSHLRGYELVRDPRLLERTRASHIQYRPDPQYQTHDWFDAVYWWCYERGHCVVYTDDVNLVIEGYRATDGMRACVTCGRERGVGMYHATQRPAGVPQILLTESEHIYAFILRNDRDRKACVDAGLDEIIRDQPIRDPYWFYYGGPLGCAPRPLKLRV